MPPCLLGQVALMEVSSWSGLAPRRPIRRGAVAVLFQRLQRVVLGLAPAGAGARVVVQRQGGFAEGVAIDLDHGLAELPALVGELLLGGANALARLDGGLAQDLLEHLLVGVGKLR